MLISLLKQIYSGPPSRNEEDIEQASDDSLACGRWQDELVARMFHLIHTFEQDNFAADRYVGVAPNAFFHDRHAAYFSFLLKNIEQFYRARVLLADESSRTLYDQLLLFRTLGHLHVRLPFNNPENRAQIATAERCAIQQTSDVGAFGPLSIYQVPGNGHDIRIKGWKENVAYTFLYRQYYFERDGVNIAPAVGDHVIDAGGCFGDTALGFADVVGEHGHVYVFDPMPKHCSIMREVVAMNPILAPRISIFPVGLADQVNTVGPVPESDMINPGAQLAMSKVPTTTIDEMSVRNSVPRIDFIKMDIEGSELSALRGAETSIRRWQPKLAISLYHRPEDFFSIPLWIDSLGVGYRFFLDHYTIHNEETVLYAAV
jgi:FkbM family methyltransferase